MLFSLPDKRDARSPSPTWSVYNDRFGLEDDDADAPDERSASSVAESSAKPLSIPYISFPPAETTLKGGHLKKQAPLRRGAQGAVYAALDTASRASHVDAVGHSAAPFLSRSPDNGGRPVAVKRIFTQSNDFGSRDIAATVLREVTIHRYVCAQEEKERRAACADTTAAVCSAKGSHGTPSDVHASARARLVSPCVLDDSARVLRLYRVVEAPFKEMCLVLERAATSLERLWVPPAGSGGGHKRKPGAVALFGRPLLDAAVSDEAHGDHDSRPAVLGAPAQPLSGASGRCPLLSQLPLVRYVMRRLLRLVCFLHEACGVVHRDLKPSNVLVTRDGGLRLGDFGSARFAPPTSLLCVGSAAHTAAVSNTAAPVADQQQSLLGTPPSMRTTLHYRSPEALFGDQSCRAAGDVWALGVMFAQLLLQKNLFHAASELELLGAIQKLLGMPARTPSWLHGSGSAASGEHSARGAQEEEGRVPAVQASLPHKLHAGVVPYDGLDLVSRMLHQLPECRLTIREAMQHPFLNPTGASAAETRQLAEDDDRVGEALWKQKVAQVLSIEEEDAKSSGSTGVRVGTGALMLQRPLMGGLGMGSDSDSGEGDDGDSESEGVAPFRVNLCGSGSLFQL